MEAFIFINAEAGQLWHIADEALKIKEIKMAHAVTGQFDVIIYAKFTKKNDLRTIIDKLQSLSGVLRTQTSIVMPTGTVEGEE